VKQEPETFDRWKDRQRSQQIAPLLADIVHLTESSKSDAPLLNWIRGFSQDGVPRVATIQVMHGAAQTVSDVAPLASLADALSDHRLVLVFRYSYTDVRILAQVPV
jgi:hypothetical protein